MLIRTLTGAALLSLTACQRTERAPVSPPAPAVDPRAAALEALEGMDGRKAVPLLPMMAHHQKQNMRDHLLAVQQIVTAVASDDFAAVEKAATRIATSPQMSQMCNHMGAGAPGFSAQALGFHQTADAIIPAAKQKDAKAVLAELGKTLATCTACHETWKQSVVDERAWAAASKSAAPSADDAMKHQHEMMMKVMQQQSPK